MKLKIKIIVYDYLRNKFIEGEEKSTHFFWPNKSQIVWIKNEFQHIKSVE